MLLPWGPRPICTKMLNWNWRDLQTLRGQNTHLRVTWLWWKKAASPPPNAERVRECVKRQQADSRAHFREGKREAKARGDHVNRPCSRVDRPTIEGLNCHFSVPWSFCPHFPQTRKVSFQSTVWFPAGQLFTLRRLLNLTPEPLLMSAAYMPQSVPGSDSRKPDQEPWRLVNRDETHGQPQTHVRWSVSGLVQVQRTLNVNSRHQPPGNYSKQESWVRPKRQHNGKFVLKTKPKQKKPVNFKKDLGKNKTCPNVMKRPDHAHLPAPLPWPRTVGPILAGPSTHWRPLLLPLEPAIRPSAYFWPHS